MVSENKVCMGEGTPRSIKIEKCWVCFLPIGLLRVFDVLVYIVNL